MFTFHLAVVFQKLDCAIESTGLVKKTNRFFVY